MGAKGPSAIGLICTTLRSYIEPLGASKPRPWLTTALRGVKPPVQSLRYPSFNSGFGPWAQQLQGIIELKVAGPLPELRIFFVPQTPSCLSTSSCLSHSLSLPLLSHWRHQTQPDFTSVQSSSVDSFSYR